MDPRAFCVRPSQVPDAPLPFAWPARRGRSCSDAGASSHPANKLTRKTDRSTNDRRRMPAMGRRLTRIWWRSAHIWPRVHNPKSKYEGGQWMLVDDFHRSSPSAWRGRQDQRKCHFFDWLIAICVATTRPAAARLPAWLRPPQRPPWCGEAQTGRLTRWPSRHDVPLTALGSAHEHRRTDSQVRFVRRFDRPEGNDRRLRRGVDVGAIPVCGPTRNKNTQSGGRGRVAREERQECVSRCVFQYPAIEFANMF
jgi:hypothetical protein